MESFPSPNSPSHLQTVTSLSQICYFCVMTTFFFYWLTRKLFFPPFLLTYFLSSLRGNYTLPFQNFSAFTYVFFSVAFRQLPSILLSTFVIEFLIFHQGKLTTFPQCTLLTWQAYFHIINLHSKLNF